MIEDAEQHLTTLNLELKAAESKVESFEAEISSKQLEIKLLGEKLETEISKAQPYERQAMVLDRRRSIRSRGISWDLRGLQKSKKDVIMLRKNLREPPNWLIEHGLTQCQLKRKRVSFRNWQWKDWLRLRELKGTLKVWRGREMTGQMSLAECGYRSSKVALLEARVEEREKEIELLLQSNNKDRASNVKALQDLLEAERKAHSIANKRAEEFSLQLEEARAKLDSLQQELTAVRLNESALDSRLRTVFHGKRLRTDDIEMGIGSIPEMTANDKRENKRSRITMSPEMYSQPEDGSSVFKGDEDNHRQQTSDREDYTKFTVQKLKQELTRHNFGAEVLQLKNPNKKDILALYEKCVLQKS